MKSNAANVGCFRTPCSLREQGENEPQKPDALAGYLSHDNNVLLLESRSSGPCASCDVIRMECATCVT